MTFHTAADYTPEQTELIRAATLTAATILGDYMDDLVVVGGLVPQPSYPPFRSLNVTTARNSVHALRAGLLNHHHETTFQIAGNEHAVVGEALCNRPFLNQTPDFVEGLYVSDLLWAPSEYLPCFLLQSH